MAPFVICTVCFAAALTVLSCTKVKSEYVLIPLLVLFGAMSCESGTALARYLLVAVIAFVQLFLISRVNVNHVIKASNLIYVITVVLLALAFVMPAAWSTYRYVRLGSFIIEPGYLVVFSLLPICRFINKMKRVTPWELGLIILMAVIELGLVFLQQNYKPVVVMCIVLLILLVKVKRDNRINVSWITVGAVNAAFIIGCLVMSATPYAMKYIDIVTTRGAFDPNGFGYQVRITDDILRAVRLVGRADLTGIDAYDTFLNYKPFLSFAVNCGWVCVVMLLLSLGAFIAKLFRMSREIKNSFAKYVCFGIATHFAVSAVFHVLVELLLGSDAHQLLFFGSSSSFVIEVLLIAIAFSLYRQRGKIKVGRQLDVDYDMTDAVLRSFTRAYEKRRSEAERRGVSGEAVRKRLSELEAERKGWRAKAKSLFEINVKYAEYERELGFTSAKSEKDLVFISYSHFDEKQADYLARQIEQLGMRAWHFKRDLRSDSVTNDYAVSIHKAIRKARVFVVILSKTSMTSEHVKNEVCLAFNQLTSGTVIMPVTIDRVSISDDETFEYFLCRQDVTSAVTPPIKKQLEAFARKIKAVF